MILMSMQKNTLLAVAGTILEWAEFTFYAYIAVDISKLFPPGFDKRAALLATFLMFALGYLVRPLGAILFGYLGDRYGRKRALLLSVFLMGVATLCIGILPTYSKIGIAAPLLLFIFRCLQGLAVAGEFNGSAIFLIEHSQRRPHLAGSWAGWAASLGMLLGSAVATIIALPSMPAWAWRVPFIAAGLTCWWVMYLRRNVKETPVFKATVQTSLKQTQPLIQLFQQSFSPFLIACSLAAVTGIFVYTMNVYYVTYLIQASGLSGYQSKLIVSLGQALVVMAYPLGGMLADRYEASPIMRYGFLLMMISAPILYIAPLTHSFSIMLLSQIPYAACDVLFSAPLFKYLNDLLPVHTRYTGLSLAWSVSMAIFGGTAPMLASYLQNYLHMPLAPAFYVMIAGLIGYIVITYRRARALEFAL